LIAAFSCTSESTEPATSSVVGTFRARTIQGTALPYLYAEQEGARYEITADEITVNLDGTWSRTTSVRATNALSRSWSEFDAKGVYQLMNGQIAFTQMAPGADEFTGAVDGETLTVAEPGRLSYVYAR